MGDKLGTSLGIEPKLFLAILDQKQVINFSLWVNSLAQLVQQLYFLNLKLKLLTWLLCIILMLLAWYLPVESNPYNPVYLHGALSNVKEGKWRPPRICVISMSRFKSGIIMTLFFFPEIMCFPSYNNKGKILLKIYYVPDALISHLI